MNILCLGTSYTGRYGAVNFSKEHSFYFLSRSPSAHKSFLYFDPAHKIEIDCILDTVPPVEIKGQLIFFHHHTVDSLLAKQAHIPYIYVSSTSVFPLSTDGSLPVFNEKSQVSPYSGRGELRLKMEEKISSYYPRAAILRPTGIYGPGRSMIENILKGSFFSGPRAKRVNRLVSRIHVHDLLRLSFALATKMRSNTNAPSLVHAVDQKTVPYEIIFSFIEEEFGISVLRESPEWQSIMANPVHGRYIHSLYADELLGHHYYYPSYEEGFRDAVRRWQLSKDRKGR